MIEKPPVLLGGPENVHLINLSGKLLGARVVYAGLIVFRAHVCVLWLRVYDSTHHSPFNPFASFHMIVVVDLSVISCRYYYS